MILLVQSDQLVDDSVAEKEDTSFVQKLAMVTEAFGGERRRRAIAAAQRNKLDAATLESTLTSAVELAQENTQREGVWECRVGWGLHVWILHSLYASEFW